MPTPIRVLAVGSVYPPHHLGGYEIIWQGVMRALRAEGHLTRILTTDYRRHDVPPSASEDPGVHRALDWYWRDHEWRKLSLLDSAGLERYNSRIFQRHLREFSPDVITWWPLGGMSLGLIELARRRGIPAAFFVLDPWLAYGPVHDRWMRASRRLGPAAAIVERCSGLPTRIDFAGAGRWVFCSETMREQTLAARPEIGGGLVLTPGVDESYLNAPPESDLPPWRWQLLYIGRVVEQKGVRTAIEALPLLPEAARLRVVGDGDPAYRHQLEQLATRLGVGERVRVEPFRPRDQLLDVYRATDAVVFPVRWAEPWGLVPLEAMAAGRPVVATGRGGSGDYLEDGQNALLFEPGDPAALAAALRKLANSAVLRRRLHDAGLETAARHGDAEFNRRAIAEIDAAARSPSGFRAPASPS